MQFINYKMYLYLLKVKAICAFAWISLRLQLMELDGGGGVIDDLLRICEPVVECHATIGHFRGEVSGDTFYVLHYTRWHSESELGSGVGIRHQDKRSFITNR